VNKQKGLMHDRFTPEEDCPKCEEIPCQCDKLVKEPKEVKELEKLRGGQ